MANRLTFSGEQWWDATSRSAYAGAKMYTYTSASRTTNKDTYDAADEGTTLANPIVADANGIFPEIYGNGAYFIDVYDSTDSTLIYQADSVYPVQPVDSSGTSFIVVATIAALQAVDTTQFTVALVEGTSAVDDGGKSHYYFDSTSTATADGTEIIAPNTGSGKWIILKTGRVGMRWMPYDSISGLKMTNDTDTDHDINITSGEVVDSTQTDIITLPSEITKQIDANWSAGDDAGGFPSGLTLTADTWYRVFIIKNVSTNTVDAGFDTSSSAANLLTDATGYTLYRRVGWVRTDSSSNILRFAANNRLMYVWDAHQTITSSVNSVGEAVDGFAPPDHICTVRYTLGEAGTTLKYGVLTQQGSSNTAPSSSFFHVAVRGDATNAMRSTAVVRLRTNSSGNIRHREDVGTDSVNLDGLGWEDDITVD